MAAPSVLTVSPVNGATDVYRNAALSLVFSEALDPDTVNTGTVLLRDMLTRQLVPVQVSLSSDGLTVTLRPVGYLAPQTQHVILVPGLDAVLVADAVQSVSTAEGPATTFTATFQTGDEVEATATTKTEAEEAEEGDLSLPSDLRIDTPSTELLITATSPEHEQFDVSADLGVVTVTFNNTLDAGTVNGNTVVVMIEPFYAEDELYLARPTDDGLCNFQFQEHTDEAGDLYDYSDPTGALSVSGDTLFWTVTPGESFPRNCRVHVVLSKDIADTDGLTLGQDRVLTFYVQLCPRVISVERVRDAFFPLTLDPSAGWTDGIIGKGLYRNMIDMLAKVRFGLRHDKIQPNLTKYVLNRTVDDLFRALRMESDLLAGQFKRVGDWAQRIDSGAVDALPSAHRLAIAEWKKAEADMRRRFIDVPLLTIRGVNHAEQRWHWRTRTWHQDIAVSLQGQNYIGPIGNSAEHRATKVAGFWERWG